MESQNSDTNENPSTDRPACACPTGPFRFVLLIAIGIILIIVLKARFIDQADPDSPAVVWGSDYPAAVALSQTLNKPILISFHASWCPPCQKMKRTTYHDPGVIAAAEQFVTLMIDTDEDKQTTSKFEIDPIPTYVIVAPDGTQLDRFAGYVAAKPFIARLNAAIKPKP